MVFVLVLFAVFSVVSLTFLPLSSSVSTVLALLIVVAVHRVVTRHLAAKPDILRHLRRRLYLGMSVGVLLEAAFKLVSHLIIGVLIMKYIIALKLLADGDVPESFAFGYSAAENFAIEHPPNDLGWGTLAIALHTLPYLVATLITPWILTLDYSQLTSKHTRVDDVTREMLVKDIVAFAAAGAIGMRIVSILLWWSMEMVSMLFTVNISEQPMVSLRETALAVMLVLQTSLVTVICQMAFCIAAAERDILLRKRTFWFALGYCVLVSVPFHYGFVIFAAAPALENIPKLLLASFVIALAFGFLELFRRKYCYLLSAARQMDAENVRLPIQFTPKVL